MSYLGPGQSSVSLHHGDSGTGGLLSYFKPNVERGNPDVLWAPLAWTLWHALENLRKKNQWLSSSKLNRNLSRALWMCWPGRLVQHTTRKGAPAEIRPAKNIPKEEESVAVFLQAEQESLQSLRKRKVVSINR